MLYRIQLLILLAILSCETDREKVAPNQRQKNTTDSVNSRTHSFPSMRRYDLLDHAMHSYPNIENIWPGNEFRNDTSTSVFRIVTCMNTDYSGFVFEKDSTEVNGFRRVPVNLKTSRTVFVERIDFSPDKSVASLVWVERLLFLDFDAEDPADVDVPVTLDKWKSDNAFVFTAGKSRYLVEMSNYPGEPVVNVVDENDNIIDAQMIDW